VLTALLLLNAHASNANQTKQAKIARFQIAVILLNNTVSR